MKIDATKVMLLTGLGVAAYLVYTKFVAGGNAESVEDAAMTLEERALQAQEGAVSAVEGIELARDVLLAGERATDGSMVFQPMVPMTRIIELLGAPYVAVVRTLQRSNVELANENGTPVPSSIYATTGGTNPWVIPQAIGRISVFNVETRREVSLAALRRDSIAKNLWMDTMAMALEDYFANAFIFACRIRPNYDQWQNIMRFDQYKRPVNVDCNTRYVKAL